MRTILPLLLLAAPAGAQNITVLVQDADVITGVGNVTAIDNLAVNDSGTWLVEADTDNTDTAADGVLIKNGAVFIRQGDIVPALPGVPINSFDGVSINNAGNGGFNFFFPTNVPASGADSGVFFNNVLVIQEGTNSIAPQLSPGSPYVGFLETKINGQNQILLMGNVDDPAITGTVDNVLVMVQVDGSGALVSESVIVKKGDMIAGIPVETVALLENGPHEFALNELGVAMYTVDLTGDTATDFVMLVGNTIVAREGDASPVAGRIYESLSSKPVDLNDVGDYVFRANLDGATTDDEVLVKNGTTVIAQEGSGIPAIGAFNFTAFGTGALRIANTGDVFWIGDWNDPDTTKDVGLFRNGELLVQEGVTMVGGMLVESIATVQDNFSISRNGRYVIFEGKRAGGIDAAFLLDLGSQPTPYCFGDGSGTACPCGNAGAAGNGCAHSLNPAGGNLAATGNASLSSDTLVLAGTGMPNSSALYFQGTNQQAGGAGAAFGDGLRCAGGTVVRLGTKTNVAGASQYPVGGDLSVSVRGLVTAPVTRTYQVWFRNAAAFCTPSTFNLTNGVEVPWTL